MRAPGTCARRIIRCALAMALTSGALTIGCGTTRPATYGPHRVEIPATESGRGPRDLTGERGTMAPPSGPAKDFAFPAIERSTFANGLSVAIVPVAATATVEIRVIVRDLARTGASSAVATLTAETMKEGGTRGVPGPELARRLEGFGATLGIHTGPDATVFAVVVLKEHVGDVLASLAQLLRAPRFDAADLRALRARATSRTTDLPPARGPLGRSAREHIRFEDDVDAAFAVRAGGIAARVVLRELFPEKSAYASFGDAPFERGRVELPTIVDLQRRAYVPKATALVLAGDVEPADAKALVEKHFGAWSGADPKSVAVAPPRALATRRIVVVHRRASAPTEVHVALLAPPRKSDDWARFQVANEVLGANPGGRLCKRLRETQALACDADARILQLAYGPQPLVVSARVQRGSRTTDVVSAILEEIARMTMTPPSSEEVERARRVLVERVVLDVATTDGVADAVATEATMGLPDDAWDVYRRAVRVASSAEVEAVAKRVYLPEHAVVVVVGDADGLAPELARFGDVTVVDADKDLTTLRTLPRTTK